MEFAVVYIILMLLFFLVLVALSRWIFRINDIIKRLDGILAAVTKKEGPIL